MRWLLAILAIVAIAFAPGSARAGDYHSSSTLICSDCHVAHFSVSHEYNEGADVPVPLGPVGPNPRLLKAADANELCLTCHDGQTDVPDVFGANSGTAGNRMGGALNAAAGHKPNDSGYAAIDGHTLWDNSIAPGGTWTNPAGLSCTDCHSAHGSAAQYRNLRTSTSATNKFFGKALTYSSVTYDGTKAVFQRNGAGAYTEADVDFNEPDPLGSHYGAWCKSCHTNFHGAPGDANMGGGALGSFLRHPTAGEDISGSRMTQFSSRTNRVKVMSPANNGWNIPLDPGVSPSCFSCHKSHGNQNGFGLIYMSGTGVVTEEGDGGAYRDLCRQCHTQGA